MRVVMLVGYPASGKSTLAEVYTEQGFVRLNRDQAGGKVTDLLWPMETSLKAGRDVLLDNTFLTPAARQPFVELAAKFDVQIECVVCDIELEQAQVNALHRMWDRYGRVFLTAVDIKAHEAASDDDNIFPIVALMAMRKAYVSPSMSEGFGSVTFNTFVRKPVQGTKKALILDYDGTLRDDATAHGGSEPYPTHPSQVKVLPHRAEMLARYKADGYALLGVSNQSGIAKGKLTDADARACFDETHRQLGISTEETVYCPHGSFPIACYCRKPQSGLGVHLIRKYDLNPAECIYVGDRGEDKTFALRLGMKYEHPDKFFRG